MLWYNFPRLALRLASREAFLLVAQPIVAVLFFHQIQNSI
jgi:hypothetical protein